MIPDCTIQESGKVNGIIFHPLHDENRIRKFLRGRRVFQLQHHGWKTGLVIKDNGRFFYILSFFHLLISFLCLYFSSAPGII